MTHRICCQNCSLSLRRRDDQGVIMGKYTNVITKLPRLVEPDNAKRDAIDALKQAILSNGPLPTIAIAGQYAELRKQIWDLEDQAKKLKVELEAWSQILISQLEAEGGTLIRLSGGTSVSLNPQPFARVTDPVRFRQWCIDNGHGDELSLPWQTTNGITKERLLEGLPEPDGVEIFADYKLRFAKGKGSGEPEMEIL